jgi:hypothetical protein
MKGILRERIKIKERDVDLKKNDSIIEETPKSKNQKKNPFMS